MIYMSTCILCTFSVTQTVWLLQQNSSGYPDHRLAVVTSKGDRFLSMSDCRKCEVTVRVVQ
jgi:hypothetical protein